MYKLVPILLFVFGCGGASSTPDLLPNLYQPENKAATDCTELEYRWETVSGNQNLAFYEGVGDFCAHFDELGNAIPQVRCVVRSPSGEIIESGPWVDSERATSIEQFRELCPGG